MLEPIRRLIEDDYTADAVLEKLETEGELNVAGLRL